MDPRTLDSSWHTLYMYIHSTRVSNHLTGMHYEMEYETLCTVESTFVVAAFVPFTLSDIRRDHFTAGKVY